MGIGVILGTLLVVTTRAWALAWLGLELNLISFLPYALSSERQKKRAINYFIIQRCGSLLLLLGGLLLDKLLAASTVIILGLVIKMGLIPLHFWVPGVVSSLKAWPLYILLSWQKVAPVALLIFTAIKHTWLIVVNAGLGALTMLTTASIPLLLVFRGILQIAWVNSLRGGFLTYYMGLYFLGLALVILFMTQPSQNIVWALLNSGGLPPLTGFMIKLKALTRLRSGLSIFLLSRRGAALTTYSRFLVNVPFTSWLVHPVVLLVGGVGIV